jgi:hypothetical protein
LLLKRVQRRLGAETCKGVIQKLWGEGWFAEAKGLSEVHSEMARRGFHYDRTAVAHALIDLVKRRAINERERESREDINMPRKDLRRK